MKVVIANDHGGVELAKKIISHLEERGIEYSYLGTASEESVDYPDYAEKAVIEYRKGGYDFGIGGAVRRTEKLFELLVRTGIVVGISDHRAQRALDACRRDVVLLRDLWIEDAVDLAV